jgi:hypothetical protein
MDIPPPFSVATRLGEMAAFEIFGFFLSEKQNCGMLFECPSPLQETAMAERSRKSRPTAGLYARQSGADELRRRFGECAADERGGKFSASQSFENSENAERISPRGRLAPLHSQLRSRACPEMAPQGPEKIEFAPGHRMVSEASNPQDVVHRRAAGPCPIGTQSRSASRKAAPSATIHRPDERGGKFSASQSLEKSQNQKILAGGLTPRISRSFPLLRRTASPPPRPRPRRWGRRGGLPRARPRRAADTIGDRPTRDR